jgi:ribosomal L7/L12-like protein
MKLDKMTFAHVIAHCVSNGMSAGEYEITVLDRLIDIEVPEQVAEQIYPKNENVERLMMLMVEGTRKIDAIREHRAITGMGLKESKEAVERYWPDGSKKLFSVADLRSKLNTETWNISQYEVIERFIQSL